MKLEFRGVHDRQIRKLSHLNGTNNAWETVCRALRLYNAYMDHKQEGREIVIIYPDNTEKPLELK